MLRRVPDWRKRLAAFIAQREHAPFLWGSQDCALFTCDAIQAMTGIDVASELRGYDSARGAVKALVDYLVKRGDDIPAWKVYLPVLLESVATRMAREHGALRIQTTAVRPGDIALARVETPLPAKVSRVLSIIGLDGKVLSAGAGGIVRGERDSLLAAWRLG